MDVEKAFGWLCITAFVAGLLAAGYVFLTAAQSNGKVDYCYIKECGYTTDLCLYGHRSWVPDILINRADTIAEVVTAAKQLDCALH